MSIDPHTLRNEQFFDIGQFIAQNVDDLVERWLSRAQYELPQAEFSHRQQLLDHLPKFLRSLAHELLQSSDGQPLRHTIVAREHGEQRWQSGWRLEDVIRDFQIMRLVLLESLQDGLDRPLDVREIMAVGLALDEAIAASSVMYATHQETQMRDAEAIAEAASRSKSEFLANMSHEIRTPMTAILGFSELLLNSISDPDALGSIQTIKRNGEHLLEIVNDILDLSKIEAGRMEVEHVRTSIVDLVNDVETTMQVRAQAKNLPIEVTLEHPLPESLVTDPTRLRQILVNLLSNAIKFTTEGSVQLIVRFVEPTQRVTFEVIDTGIGMSREQLTRIFKAFSQGDSTTPRLFGGTGLGLSISQQLATMLGGEITVQSDSGSGRYVPADVASRSLARHCLGRPESAARHFACDCPTCGRPTLALPSPGG